VPRVEPVPGEIPGAARYVATSVVQEGFATGAILQHRMSRPVKLEGNPDHPASLGASDALMQATLLDLYDPERSSAVLAGGQIVPWEKIEAALAAKRQQWLQDGGRGLRILTGRMTSPSLAARLAELLKQYPGARWHQWEPLARDSVDAGALLAFGRRVDALPLFENADIVLAIESDAISGAPGHLAFARAFSERRRAAEAGSGRMSRVYAIEATPTLLGAVADHRFVLKPGKSRWRCGRSLLRSPRGRRNGTMPSIRSGSMQSPVTSPRIVAPRWSMPAVSNRRQFTRSRTRSTWRLARPAAHFAISSRSR
jgi:hypothetical protein